MAGSIMARSKVLLIDDEEDMRLIGRACLSVAGRWDVVVASSGAEGVALALRERPAAILLDVLMPGLDGPAILARLRHEPATRVIPVVFLTGRTQPGEVERYLEMGAAGVLSKPFDPLRLPAELERLLDAASIRARLDRLRELGGANLVRSLIDLFLTNAPARIAAARNAAAVGDWHGLEFAAHSLKSSAGNLGAEAVRWAAEAVEKDAAQRRPEALPALLDSLAEACAWARSCLEERRGPGG
jgi:CheY-like chemotaxis protein